jgi:hypothetical protein
MRYTASLEMIAFRFRDSLFIAGLTAVVAVVLNSRVVYSAGTGDHLVLLPAGLQKNNSELYLNDYLVSNAQQPHWFFESTIAWADSQNILAGYLFAYWLITIGVSVVALFLLASDISKPHRYYLTSISTLILAFGIRTPAGTSTILLEQALPHAMGGAFSLLTTWAILSKRRTIAFLGTLLVSLFHVQFGGLMVVFQLLSLVHDWRQNRKLYPSTILKVTFNLLVIIMIASARPIVGNYKEFTLVCDLLIPYHCSAQVWSDSRLATVALISIGAFMYSWDRKSFNNIALLTIGLASVGLLAGTLINVLEVPVLTELVQGNNIYRIGALLLPFSIMWAVYQPIAFVIHDVPKNPLATIRLLFSSAIVFQLLTSVDDYGGFASHMYLGLLAVVFVSIFPIFYSGIDKVQTVMRSLVFLAFVALISQALSPIFSFDTKVIPNQEYRNAGSQIASLTRSGSIVAADPSQTWVRMASGRAVVVDCKYKPIETGEPLRRYLQVFDQIGGFDQVCNRGAWGKYEQSDIESLFKWANNNSANFIVLKRTDEVLEQIASLKLGTLGTFEVDSKEFVLVGVSSN